MVLAKIMSKFLKVALLCVDDLNVSRVYCNV